MKDARQLLEEHAKHCPTYLAGEKLLEAGNHEEALKVLLASESCDCRPAGCHPQVYEVFDETDLDVPEFIREHRRKPEE